MADDPRDRASRTDSKEKVEPPRIDRRSFLRAMHGILGGTVALGGVTLSPVLVRKASGHGKDGSLAKFVDPLPLPRVIAPVRSLDGAPLYEVSMRQFKQKLHRDLPPTTLWGYNALYPGPTFEARRDTPIAVRWRNSLPTRHMLPIDPTSHGAEPPTPEVRTVVHLHGHKVLPDSDGYPEAWFTNGFAQTGPFFTTQIYYYPNDQPATTLWYHDHALGITWLNLYTGLAGFYFLRDQMK